MEKWNQELAGMNRGKRGAPYQFPESLIGLQALWPALEILCRMMEGMTRDPSRMGQLPDYNDYSTVSRRINDLDYCLIPPGGNNLVIFSDGTGLQAVNGGKYLREKYGKKNRQWIQIILLGDAVTHEPVSYEINLLPASEPDSTQKQVTKLLSSGLTIKSVGGDGGLDKKSLRDFLDQQGIRPVIKPDENALSDTDCIPRNKTVFERNKRGYKRWAKKAGYGHRWTATEGIFSAIKRMFGEEIKAASEKGMLQEAACKIWTYQKLKKA
ncbi:MAG: transposase [Candidatus Altiarchaeota archaeon]|nr:transposase [Candidatus Altiarchaeota archaeon]